MSAYHFTAALLAAGSLLAAPAQARDDLSGTWKEEFTETIYSVEQWGAACGVAPKSPGRKEGGTLWTIRDRGIDLLFEAGGLRFSSSDCQTSNKAVVPKERTEKGQVITISCATPEDAPAYENGLYSFRFASPTRIEFREVTRFSRNIEGSLCAHTRRVFRPYTRVSGPAASDANAASPAPAPQPPADPCARPGAPVSVAFEPRAATAGQGDTLCLVVQAVDRGGCKVEAPLAWPVNGQPKDLELSPLGCLLIARDAALGPRMVKLVSASIAIELKLNVVDPSLAPPRPERPRRPRPISPEAPPAAASAAQADATRPAATAPPGPPTEAVPPKTAPIGPSAAAAAPSPGPSSPAWLLPVAVGGGLLVAALIAAVVLLGRQRRPARVSPDPVRPGIGLNLPEAAPPLRPEIVSAPTRIEPLRAVSFSAPTDAPGRWCNTCGAALASEATFCTACGAKVQERSPRPEVAERPEAPVAQPPEAARPVSFCIQCGAGMPEGALFCPFCRHKQDL